jgi:hypothetical protein
MKEMIINEIKDILKRLILMLFFFIGLTFFIYGVMESVGECSRLYVFLGIVITGFFINIIYTRSSKK